MSELQNAQTREDFGTQQVWKGFCKLAPISMFVVVFGAAFGLAAAQQGLSDASTVAMSALVFAGYAQFAALDMWGAQVPLFTLLATVFAINARHLLMGATLYPWLSSMSVRKRYGVMTVVSDANWALSLQQYKNGQPGLGVLFGGGLAIWLFWVIGTWLGVAFGSGISGGSATMERFGLDMVVGCFLLSMAFGGEQRLREWLIWLVAAAVSLLVWGVLEANSYVVAGAVAGGLFNVLLHERKPQQTEVTS